jgi:hypothetical protein
MRQKIAMSFVVQPQLRDNGNAKLDDALANNSLYDQNSSCLRQTFLSFAGSRRVSLQRNQIQAQLLLGSLLEKYQQKFLPVY